MGNKLDNGAEPPYSHYDIASQASRPMPAPHRALLTATLLAATVCRPTRAADFCADLTAVIRSTPTFASHHRRPIDKDHNEARYPLEGFTVCGITAGFIDKWATYACNAPQPGEQEARALSASLIAATAASTFSRPTAPERVTSRNGGWTVDYAIFSQHGSRLVVVVELNHIFPGGFRPANAQPTDSWSVRFRISGNPFE